MAPIQPKVIRCMFGIGERVAPGLTGRAAFALFSRTPNPGKLTAGESRAVSSAAGFMQEARPHMLETRTGRVAAYEFSPRLSSAGQDTVLVVHGWRSRTEYMRWLIAGYRDAGYRVVSLDLPGHGRSEGRKLTMFNALDTVRAASDRLGPFAAVVGHSFGGAVALNAIAGSIPGIAPLSVKRLVLVAAPNSIPAVFEGFSQALNVGPRSQSAMSQRLHRMAGRPLSDFIGDRQLAELQVPTLVVHAPDDREVPAEQAQAFTKAGPHVQIYWAEGLGHRRILADPAVVERSVDFVARAKPVPVALAN